MKAAKFQLILSCLQLRDIAKAWLETEENKRRRRILQGLGSGDNPPVKTEYSGDLLEYAATQEIPRFGVHAFYALSKDPLPNWDNVEKGVFPKGNTLVRNITSSCIT